MMRDGAELVHLAELERVVDGNRLLYMPARCLGGLGGEWDWLRALSAKQRRRLIGAGWLSRVGERPDVLADAIIREVGGVETLDEALTWYVRHALAAIPEARREAHRRRHDRRARALGFPSYYHLRAATAREHGHGSFWHMRKDRGWK